MLKNENNQIQICPFAEEELKYRKKPILENWIVLITPILLILSFIIGALVSTSSSIAVLQQQTNEIMQQQQKHDNEINQVWLQLTAIKILEGKIEQRLKDIQNRL